MDSEPLALHLAGLQRRYDGCGGVADVSLSVPHGARFVLCGPNGSGKTTTLSVLAGLMYARQGQLTLSGEPIPLDRPVRRRGLGFVPDSPILDEGLTPWQWARFASTIKAQPLPADAERWAGVLRLDLADVGRPIRTLSFGTRRKAALWTELLTTGALLLMDEPLIGLDPEAINGLLEALVEWTGGGRTVILSTHLLQEAEAFATHVGIIREGCSLAEGTVAQICGDQSLRAAFLSRTQVPR